MEGEEPIYLCCWNSMFISVPTLLLVQPSPSQNDTIMILSSKWLHFDATYLPVFISYLHIFWCLGPPNTEICICLSCLVCVSFGSFSHLYKSTFSLVMIWHQLPFTHASTHEGTMGWSKKKYVYNIYIYTHTILIFRSFCIIFESCFVMVKSQLSWFSWPAFVVSPFQGHSSASAAARSAVPRGAARGRRRLGGSLAKDGVGTAQRGKI